jgi:hypothetical protein
MKHFRRSNMPRFWSFAIGVGMLPAISIPGLAATPVTACGTILGACGNYRLAADLNCGPNSLYAAVLIMANDFDFNLNGHTITNALGLIFGIATPSADPVTSSNCVAASNVHIHGGTLTGSGGIGILLCAPVARPR